jgi:hypothetical protein
MAEEREKEETEDTCIKPTDVAVVISDEYDFTSVSTIDPTSSYEYDYEKLPNSIYTKKGERTLNVIVYGAVLEYEFGEEDETPAGLWIGEAFLRDALQLDTESARTDKERVAYFITGRKSDGLSAPLPTEAMKIMRKMFDCMRECTDDNNRWSLDWYLCEECMEKLEALYAELVAVVGLRPKMEKNKKRAAVTQKARPSKKAKKC